MTRQVSPAHLPSCSVMVAFNKDPVDAILVASVVPSVRLTRKTQGFDRKALIAGWEMDCGEMAGKVDENHTWLIAPWSERFCG